MCVCVLYSVRMCYIVCGDGRGGGGGGGGGLVANCAR